MQMFEMRPMVVAFFGQLKLYGPKTGDLKRMVHLTTAFIQLQLSTLLPTLLSTLLATFNFQQLLTTLRLYSTREG